MRAKQKGVASIEFAIGFFAFWLMCMAWVEMSYISYISAINDLAISEITRTAKKGSDNYMDAVHEVLHREDSIWNQVVDGDDFQVTIQYVESIKDLVNVDEICSKVDVDESAECGNPDHAALAIYRINYRFKPIFSYFFTTQDLMSREMIVVQEYERSQFEV
ncbi:pilus assembly protein [Vibrio aquaticus]|uniref:Pilus assembly protein n=1 Tax=Vibrio aquaticus TaxID=2496559 RepID=A0A432CT84_9VIBR|nr:TadE family protein [Vibrio aquaticus]RTZ14464.1 pilus assembly protein [Vibrio aquaticus]